MELVKDFIFRLFKVRISTIQLSRARNLLKKRPIRMVIGAGNRYLSGWIHTDIKTLDITNEDDWERHFDSNSIDIVLCEHVLEHLDLESLNLTLTNCFKYLKEGGAIRIAVPDGFHPSQDYINAVKPGGSGWGSDDHKHLFTFKSLSQILRTIGFEVSLLEYFDEVGQFHLHEWKREDGFIKRSSLNDPRNQDGILHYTSLILDGKKPRISQK